MNSVCVCVCVCVHVRERLITKNYVSQLSQELIGQEWAIYMCDGPNS